MNFYITDEEKNALKLYKEKDYESINQILISNSEIDVNILSDESNKRIISYSKENVEKYIDIIKKVYELMQKKYVTLKNEAVPQFFRGTNISEIERIKNEPYIDRFLSVTTDENIAKTVYSANWNRPAMLNIKIEQNIPYINVNEILGLDISNNEYVISPFTIIKEISEKQEENLENNKLLKKYELILTKQNLESLSQDEKNGLYNYVMNNANSIDEKLEDAVALEKINLENYENIRKLEQLLSKYEIENEKKESQVDFDDIDRINNQLDEIKLECSEIFKQKKDIINFVTIWKRNLILYLMAECKEIEEKYKISYQTEEEKAKENSIEEIKVQDEQNIKSEEVLEKSEEIVEPIKNIDEIDKKDEYYEIKKECKENIEAVENLLNNIQKLISKQQNHAKIAGNLGTTYSALNNGFEMKKNAEELDILVKNIKLKVYDIIQNEEKEEVKEKIEKISKNNIQISTLLNYLNNPKSSIGIANITRFDEMAIIEENELKRGIYQSAREIMGEAELKKLKDDMSIIEEKSPIEKLMGIFTGKNKLDEIMIEQIEIRQNAIRKTLAQKLSLANNYSIHEIVAFIKMFVKENYDDNLILDDVSDLEALDRELRNNFVILDSKIESIIAEKEGRNLPLDNKKITKKEALEIDTYRFLNKYGYDIKKYDDTDIHYQDTMSSEILRIVEYINSANIL